MSDADRAPSIPSILAERAERGLQTTAQQLNDIIKSLPKPAAPATDVRSSLPLVPSQQKQPAANQASPMSNADRAPSTPSILAERGLQSNVFDPCGNVPAAGDYLTVQRENLAALENVYANSP